ncbi:hypothetical protein D3C71_2106510 [compost metagenome]
MQGLSIGPAVATAASIVEVGDGETPLCPVLNARVEHRIAGRGGAAMDEHHQRRFGDIAQGWIKEPVGLACAAGVAQSLWLADVCSGQ